jgi:hypothetical protein
MVFPFDLLCKECGSIIFSRRTGAGEILIDSLQNDLEVASWLSENLRGRKLICPKCKRLIPPDPLVRADVFFADWGKTSKQDSTIVYYV